MARITYSDVVGAGRGWTRFSMPDGRQVTVAGDRAMRNNNPGNIEYGRFTRQYGAIGTDGRFAAFPTREMGILAQAGLLFGPNYRNLTLAQAIAKYAPQFENNTAAYAARVSKLSGVSLTTKLSDVPASQQKSVITAMHEVEGNTPVRAFDAQGRPRGVIDRNHPLSYQTQPSPGGFDFNNPGGFSPPHPTTQDLATADYSPRTVQNMVRPDLNEAQQRFTAPVSPVERRSLPAVGASSFPARPGVIAPNNTRTATPALDRALEQRGISRPSAPTPAGPAPRATFHRDPASLPNGPVSAAPVEGAGGFQPTFAGQQPALTSPTSLSSFPARPTTIAPNTRPHLAAALQKAGIVTPGDPAPTRLQPSLEKQQLAPVAGVPVTTVRTRPVEVRAVPQQPKPTQVAPVQPRQIAPVQPRVVQPVQQPPQPVEPVQAPAPIGQQAFDARANPVDPGLRAADVYGGAIGTAQASTPGTTVSRQNSWGPTTVTNKFGAQTAMVGDRQAAVGKPFGGLGGNLSPNAKSVLGGLAGGILGAMAAGPTGALAGGMLGRKMASGGLGGSSAPGGGGGQAGGGLLGGMFGGGTVGNARGGNNERSGGTGGGTIGGGGGRGRRGGQGN